MTFAVAAVLLTACGSTSGGANGDSAPKAAASPTVKYFTASDVTGLNRASAAAYKAITKAQKRRSQAACDRAGNRGYVPWRACWHGLLDPVKNSLSSVGAEFRVLAGQDFPTDCLTRLKSGGETYLGFAGRVQGLLKGIDSDKRAAQERALRVYPTTLNAVLGGSAKPFQDATQSCYSPQDLESINAKPTPSATPSSSSSGP
jgi:hypothetical protein